MPSPAAPTGSSPMSMRRCPPTGGSLPETEPLSPPSDGDRNYAEVVGKPAAPLYEMAARIIGAPTAALLAIGDRLETDIAGAIAAGMESVLVCTGVHGPREIALAPANARPTCVLRDLRGLTQPYVAPLRSAAGWECGGAQVAIVDNALHIDAGPERREEVARAAIAAIWEAIDAGLDRDHAASLANHIPGLD